MNDLRIHPDVRPENQATTKGGRTYTNLFLITNRNAKVKKVLTFLNAVDVGDALKDLIMRGEATEECWRLLAQGSHVNPLNSSRAVIRERLLLRFFGAMSKALVR